MAGLDHLVRLKGGGAPGRAPPTPARCMSETCLLRTDARAALDVPAAERLDTSHHSRDILAFRCYGDLHPQEIHVEIDWQDGDDARRVTYRPVASAAKARACPRQPHALPEPPVNGDRRKVRAPLPVVRVTA